MISFTSPATSSGSADDSMKLTFLLNKRLLDRFIDSRGILHAGWFNQLNHVLQPASTSGEPFVPALVGDDGSGLLNMVETLKQLSARMLRETWSTSGAKPPSKHAPQKKMKPRNQAAAVSAKKGGMRQRQETTSDESSGGELAPSSPDAKRDGALFAVSCRVSAAPYLMLFSTSPPKVVPNPNKISTYHAIYGDIDLTHTHYEVEQVIVTITMKPMPSFRAGLLEKAAAGAQEDVMRYSKSAMSYEVAATNESYMAKKAEKRALYFAAEASKSMIASGPASEGTDKNDSKRIKTHRRN